MKADSSSMQCGEAGSAVWTRIGEATRCATEADALRTGGVLCFALHALTGSDASAARASSRRGVSRRDRRATWRCDTDFRRVGHIEDELEASVCESALSAQGGARLPADHARRRSFRSCAHRCRREATPSQTAFTLLPRFGDAQSPNRAMELTATRRTDLAFDGYSSFTRCHARSRSQQLILFSLGYEQTGGTRQRAIDDNRISFASSQNIPNRLIKKNSP